MSAWSGRYYRGAMRDRRAAKRAAAEQRNAAAAAGNREAARRRRAAGTAGLRAAVDSIATGFASIRVDAAPALEALADLEAQINRALAAKWCFVDDCPASICGGPHIDVETTFGVERIRPDQSPIGQPLTAAQPGASR